MTGKKKGDNVSVNSFEDLKAHAGHKITCITYGKPAENAAVECETCNEVLLDFDKNKEKERR
ncbi:MAG TPA: hypothetical protein ENH41_03405 [Candidatus Omnitrophica bacterium]|nr:hypothetical protein [Candidatus Omnitrophota bacterium]